MIEGIAFKKAGRPVTAADHKPRGCLVGETETRHELVIGRVVTGSRRAYHCTCDGSGRDAARILDDPAVQQDVRSLVMRFIPGLIEFVTQAKVERELRRKFEIILDVACHSPLPVADDPDGRAQLAFRGAIQNKICRAISSPAGGYVGIAGKAAVVVKAPKKPEV